MKATYRIEVKKLCRKRLVDFVRERFSDAKRSTARVLCFPGREAIEVIEVYKELGIPFENILCLEQRRSVYNELVRRNLGVNIKCQRLDQFIGSPRQGRFDIVSLDFTGQLGTFENSIYRLKKNGFLDENAIVFTNFCGAREADASKGPYYIARHRSLQVPDLSDLVSIMERWRKARHSESALKRILKEYEDRDFKPYWDEPLSVQRSAGIHETVRSALTFGSYGLTDILFRERDYDGSLSKQAQDFLRQGFKSELHKLPAPLAEAIKKINRAAAKKDDAIPGFMLLNLALEAKTQMRDLVKQFARRSRRFSFDVDLVTQILRNGLETFLGCPYRVLATQSYKYVSDGGTPMYADMFHIRRLSEFDFLGEHVPKDATSLDELSAAISGFSEKNFLSLIDLIAQAGTAVAKLERSAPGTPDRIDLGRESDIGPRKGAITTNEISMKAGALKLLVQDPQPTIEDVALALGAKPMQVAAWKAHMTMGTYASAADGALETLADSAYGDRRYPEALKLTDRLLKRDPSSPRLLNNRAVILHALGHPKRARDLLVRALHLSPGHPTLLLTQATQLEETGRLTEALDIYEKLSMVQPLNALVVAGKGDVFRKLHKYEHAKAQYEKALALDASCYEAHYGMAVALSDENRLTEAILAFDALVTRYPKTAYALYNRSVVLAKLARYQDATRDLRAAVELDPSDFAALYNLGCCLLELKEDSEAAATFARAVHLDPSNTPALLNLAAAHSRLGNHAAAIEVYDQMLKRHPPDPETAFRRIRALRASGRFHDALSACNRLVRAKQDSPSYRVMRGKILLDLNRFTDAQVDFEWAASRDETNRDALLGRAQVSLTQGEHHQALRQFTDLTYSDPQDLTALLGRADSLTGLGREEEAVTDFDRVLSTDPANAAALNGKGMALSRLDKPGDALKCFEAAMRADPSLHDPIYNKATLHAKQGEFDEALAVFDSCLERNPRDHQALCNRGTLKLIRGDVVGAEVDFLQALSLNSEDEIALARLHEISAVKELVLKEQKKRKARRMRKKTG